MSKDKLTIRIDDKVKTVDMNELGELEKQGYELNGLWCRSGYVAVDGLGFVQKNPEEPVYPLYQKLREQDGI